MLTSSGEGRGGRRGAFIDYMKVLLCRPGTGVFMPVRVMSQLRPRWIHILYPYHVSPVFQYVYRKNDHIIPFAKKVITIEVTSLMCVW